VAQPLGFERGYNKIGGQQDRSGLGKEEPETFHG
jgi:hypothetical protein